MARKASAKAAVKDEADPRFEPVVKARSAIRSVVRGLLVDDGVTQVAQLPDHGGQLPLERLDYLLVPEHDLREVGVLPLQMRVADLQVGESSVHGPHTSRTR